MDEKQLLANIKSGIHLFNEGSDNAEYLRGQVELAAFLLGWDNDDKRIETELETASN